MYIYNQKRISSVEFFLTQFKNYQLFINLFEHLRIIYYIQYLNFSLLKIWKIFYIVNISRFIIKVYYYRLIDLILNKKQYHFQQKKKIIKYLKYKWKSAVNTTYYRKKMNIVKTLRYWKKKNAVRTPYYQKKKNAVQTSYYCVANMQFSRLWSLVLIKIVEKLGIKLCLIKPLYAALIGASLVSNSQLKISVIRTQYLIYKPYFFDFLLTILLICNYALSTYFLILLTWHLQRQFKHKKHIWIILTFLKNFYFLKPQILGIKLLIKGPFDKHGRTRTFLKQVGVIKSFTNYRFQFVCDKISCIGIYGIFNIKFWILYI